MTVEIIPAIDLKGGRCVRLRQGRMEDETVFSDNPAAVARRWEDAGASRIHLVDLDGAVGGAPANARAVEAIVAAVRVPTQLGGGIRTRETMDFYRGLGVRRVILGTAALDRGALATLCDGFAGEVAVGVDARDGLVAVKGWTETAAVRATDLVRGLAGLPVAAVIYTDISRDGMMQGPNVEAMAAMLALSPAPLIASGGVSRPEDVQRLCALEGLAGMIIGRALYDGRVDLAAAVRLASGR
ncbi:MAG TPA: 1-(5-phosphoribosyl)-5-[(5-phosphoribosylamino)methylideneamino]imidazole-4-carboxamide isomerase [Candidatus Methanoperedens sp.]|nr:1-(5-phosphoribosyl)-5-[(5-phosphoribosylamino)methylideneamino]imidazole-4-carboxamide isomerase [Candidatus Methanoperedens sp.]